MVVDVFIEPKMQISVLSFFCFGKLCCLCLQSCIMIVFFTQSFFYFIRKYKCEMPSQALTFAFVLTLTLPFSALLAFWFVVDYYYHY